ncbi:hypothetical protein [Streptomyces sp. MI02-7b]|uniref:hypothetical protein n=1 Tax=Streptomyces sp. MI02-7b TaxID=462941 RepID=UPI0029ADA6DB|nr:hypothetical protein [Streptomyces sp. MI02-7b]MDX3077762.1 hypothetical protein [Streptomyces sp. MI02-7b]
MTEMPAVGLTDLRVPLRTTDVTFSEPYSREPVELGNPDVTQVRGKDIAMVLLDPYSGETSARRRPGAPPNVMATVHPVPRAHARAFIGDGLRDALDPNSSSAKARGPRKPKSTSKEGRTS